MMTDIFHTAVGLLMFSILTCVNGEYICRLAEHGYDIIPCEQNKVCIQIWPFIMNKTHDYIATLSNGKIQMATNSEDLKCNWKIRNDTADDVRRLECTQFNGPTGSPGVKLTPGKTESLHCVLLSYLQTGLCYTQQQQQLSLTWVDETDAEIKEDENHQIKHDSSCAVSLTVTLKTSGKKKFRCRATVGQQVQTSEELQVGLKGSKIGGRVKIKERRQKQVENNSTVGPIIGLMGCAVLSMLVAVFVVNKTRRQESCTETLNNRAVNPDDVVYAEIMLPVSSNRVLFQTCESTEYASVLYK